MMRSRIIVGAFLLLGVLALGTVETRGDSVSPAKHWAVVDFAFPVQIGNDVVMGPCLIVHDDARMARGEPCTSVQRFDSKKGPQEELVSFHCRPVERPVAEQTVLTFSTFASSRVPGVRRLIEYQLGGETEGHGIPSSR